MLKKTVDIEAFSEMLEGKGQIIPIIAADDDQLKPSGRMPDELPILTLRSSVMFPGAITPITVGRDKSVKLIRDAQKSGALIGAVLQKNSAIENPEPDDLYSIGTAASILKIFEMPNGNLTAILHGTEKFEIREYTSTDPYYKATVTPLVDIPANKKSEEFKNLCETIRMVAIEIVSMSSSIPQEAQLAIKNIDSARGLINFVSSNMDFNDDQRQELLETSGLIDRAQRLLEILIEEKQLLEV